MKTPLAALGLGILLLSVSAPARADSPWNSGVGALHFGTQIGSGDRAGYLVSAYFGGDYALFQRGLDLGVISFLGLGAAISTHGHVLGLLTPIAVGTDHVQLGFDLVWSPGRDDYESAFGLSLRVPLSFY